jgi:hypothetical protein
MVLQFPTKAALCLVLVYKSRSVKYQKLYSMDLAGGRFGSGELW